MHVSGERVQLETRRKRAPLVDGARERKRGGMRGSFCICAHDGKKLRGEATEKSIPSSRDPRCNGVIGYELTGLRSPSWRGSRRRKLVEGNRFITRDRQEGRGRRRKRRRAEHEETRAERKRRAVSRALYERLRRMLRVSSSRSFFLCFFAYIYIHTHTTRFCCSFPSFLLRPCFAPRLRGLSTSPWAARGRAKKPKHNRAWYIPSISAYRGKPYRTPHLSLSLSSCVFLHRNLMRAVVLR